MHLDENILFTTAFPPSDKSYYIFFCNYLPRCPNIEHVMRPSVLSCKFAFAGSENVYKLLVYSFVFPVVSLDHHGALQTYTPHTYYTYYYK